MCNRGGACNREPSLTGNTGEQLALAQDAPEVEVRFKPQILLASSSGRVELSRKKSRNTGQRSCGCGTRCVYWLARLGTC